MGLDEAVQRALNGRHAQKVRIHGPCRVLTVGATAIQIAPCVEPHGDGVFRGRREPMRPEFVDVADGVAIRGHVTIEPPLAAKERGQQRLAGARWHAIHFVVCRRDAQRPVKSRKHDVSV